MLLRVRPETSPVCLVTADLPLLPGSRGTAAALWSLGVALVRSGLRVHLVLASHSRDDCDASAARAAALSPPGGRLTTSCALVAARPEEAPLEAHVAVRARLDALLPGCSVVVTHEWGALAIDHLVERAFPSGAGGAAALPPTLLNFHGGTFWSSSWARLGDRAAADWASDAAERVCSALCDAAVFPNDYMRFFHADAWPLPPSRGVVPNIGEGARGAGAWPPPRARLAPVRGVAFVAAVETRKGVDALAAALAGLDPASVGGGVLPFHVFGALGRVRGQPAAAYLAAALAGVGHVNLTVHGAVAAEGVWAALVSQRLLLAAPSLLENQPTTLLQAAAHGVPALAYDVGGVRDMLHPACHASVLVPPRPTALAAALQAAVTARAATVPRLADAVVAAPGAWVEAVRRASAPRTSPRPTAAAAAAPAARVVTVDTSVPFGCAQLGREVRTQLAGAGARAGGVALLLIDTARFAPLPGTPARLARLAAQLSGGGAGFVDGLASEVAMSRLRGGGAIAPLPPFYFVSAGWRACAPVAPLLVRADAALAFLDDAVDGPPLPGGGDPPFDAWRLSLWLFHGAGRRGVVARVPQPLFRFTGCVDPVACFWLSEHVAPPPRLLRGPGRAMRLPFPGASARAAAFDAGGAPFERLLADQCAPHNVTPMWLAAAAAPALCGGSFEHGVFSARSLRTAALLSCGGHCLFPVSSLPAPPAPAIGWWLDATGSAPCWTEVGSNHYCAAWFGQRAQSLPGAMGCHDRDPPQGYGGAATGVGPPRAEGRPPCDELVPPSPRAPGGACGPRLLLVGFPGCEGRDGGAVARLLSANVGAGAPPPHAPAPTLAARRRALTSPGGPAADDAAALASGGPMFDASLVGSHLGTTPAAAAAAKALLPSSVVAMLVCDPVAAVAQRWAAAAGRRTDGGGEGGGDDSGDGDALADARVATLPALAAALAGGCRPAGGASFGDPACARLLARWLAPGRFAPALADWEAAFGRRRVAVVHASRLAADPEGVAAVLFAHAGWGAPAAGFVAPPRDTPLDDPPAPLTPDTAQQLGSLFGDYNAWLVRGGGLGMGDPTHDAHPPQADLIQEDFPNTWGVDRASRQAYN